MNRRREKKRRNAAERPPKRKRDAKKKQTAPPKKKKKHTSPKKVKKSSSPRKDAKQSRPKTKSAPKTPRAPSRTDRNKKKKRTKAITADARQKDESHRDHHIRTGGKRGGKPREKVPQTREEKRRLILRLLGEPETLADRCPELKATGLEGYVINHEWNHGGVLNDLNTYQRDLVARLLMGYMPTRMSKNRFHESWGDLVSYLQETGVFNEYDMKALQVEITNYTGGMLGDEYFDQDEIGYFKPDAQIREDFQRAAIGAVAREQLSEEQLYAAFRLAEIFYEVMQGGLRRSHDRPYEAAVAKKCHEVLQDLGLGDSLEKVTRRMYSGEQEVNWRTVSRELKPGEKPPVAWKKVGREPRPGEQLPQKVQWRRVGSEPVRFRKVGAESVSWRTIGTTARKELAENTDLMQVPGSNEFALRAATLEARAKEKQPPYIAAKAPPAKQYRFVSVELLKYVIEDAREEQRKNYTPLTSPPAVVHRFASVAKLAYVLAYVADKLEKEPPKPAPKQRAVHEQPWKKQGRPYTKPRAPRRLTRRMHRGRGTMRGRYRGGRAA